MTNFSLRSQPDFSVLRRSSKKIDDTATRLSSTGFSHIIDPGVDYPAPILSTVGEEEAAKILILLDGVRCPLTKPPERLRTLDYFYDHLAKAIYAETCNWHPANFAEMVRLIEIERQMYYLDGPTGADWLFYNQNLQRREDALYVGYECEASDATDSSTCIWTSPLRSISSAHSTKNVFPVVRALHGIGLLKLDALKVVASIWRGIEVCPLTSSSDMQKLNTSTLEKLQELNLLEDAADETYRIVIDHWPIPLWSINVGTPLPRESRELKKKLLDEKLRFSGPI